jgi:hypothetical protein
MSNEKIKENIMAIAESPRQNSNRPDKICEANVNIPAFSKYS